MAHILVRQTGCLAGSPGKTARQTGSLAGRPGNDRLPRHLQPGAKQNVPGAGPAEQSGRPAYRPDGPATAGSLASCNRAHNRTNPALAWPLIRRLPAGPAPSPADRTRCRTVRPPARQTGYFDQMLRWQVRKRLVFLPCYIYPFFLLRTVRHYKISVLELSLSYTIVASTKSSGSPPSSIQTQIPLGNS